MIEASIMRAIDIYTDRLLWETKRGVGFFTAALPISPALRFWQQFRLDVRRHL